MTEEARRVLAVLRDDRPLRGKDIARMVGLASEKRVSDAIAELRREHGYLIIAGQDGYRLARTEAEKRAYVAALDRRIAGLARTRRAIVQRHPEVLQLPF